MIIFKQKDLHMSKTIIRKFAHSIYRHGVLPAAIGLLLVAGSCRHAPQAKDSATDAAKAPTPVAAEATHTRTSIAKAGTQDETPLNVNVLQAAAGQNENVIKLLDRRELAATAKKDAATTEYPCRLVQNMRAPDDKVKVSFNFDAAPLTEVVPLFASLLNFNYYIDPAVKGGVTLTMDTELTGREVWELFEHILWLSGTYASPTPGLINVLPFNKMGADRRIFASHDPKANVEVSIIPIRHGKSAEMINNIKPFMTEGSTVTDVTRLNSLLLVEAPPNMQKIQELIRRLDEKGEDGWPMACIPCHSVDAEDLADELIKLLPVLGLPVTDKPSASSGEIKLTPIARLQVIIVSAALPEVVAEVEKWVHALDQDNVGEQENIFFYNVRHSTADHLTEALDVFFNTTTTASTETKKTSNKSTSSRAEGNNPATPSSPNSQNRSSSNSRRSKTNTGTPGATKTEGTAKTIFDVPVTIYADTYQNRLTIRTSPRAYAMVDALLKRLDVQPRQVKIQAMITEVTLNKNTQFGFNYAAKNFLGGSNWGLSNFNLNTTGANMPTPATSGVASGASLLLNSSNDGKRIAFLQAVAGEDNIRVISSPEIVAKNDEEAAISVGDSIPVLNGYNNTANSGVSTGTNTSNYGYSSSVQYQETGTKLTVTPHITAGNEVNMEIEQEVSDAVKNTASTIDSPTIQKRTLKTVLVVPDGSTVLMGGMIKTKSDDSNNGLPWLKDIPWLGHLFRSNASSRNRTELLVLITVNVLDQPSETDKMAQRYQAALKEIHEKSNANPREL